VASCETGWADCGGATDGCETNLVTDPLHCGDCANACVAANGAAVTCQYGACAFAGCQPNQADCNHLLSDGCEASLLTDPLNCGSCGAACPAVANGAPACSLGKCTAACDAGFADCDGDLRNGCEVRTTDDPANCGACAFACPVPEARPATCANSQCGTGECAPGHADCDGVADSGCEVTLSTDPLNCGACGFACPAVAGAPAACANFTCGMGACDAGFADCSGGAANGCETSTDTDPDNCGACNQPCAAVPNGTRACQGAACVIGGCDAGYADCDSALANGCETNLKTDPNHCNACGAACTALPGAVAACVDGGCGLGACTPGFSNCDSDATNGCETNSATNPANCGGCGVKCGSGSCVDSACVCLMTALVIADDSASGAAMVGAALTAAGFTVTQSAVPSYQYNGTNPALTGFGAVVLLAGGPGAASFSTDMPTAGQTALVNYVAAGNGLVLTEWAAYQVASGRWTTLAPLVLLARTNSYTGQVTYSVDPAFASHPLWAGLPASFTIASASNIGLTKVATGVTRVAGSPQAIDAVALRDARAGRVVHLAHAGNYAPNGWTNSNMQKLIANAAKWTARCP
jgi:hypothetical protein